jgi:uncharacterized membrane protein
MTGPVPPEDTLAGLAAELGELTRRLTTVQTQLLVLRSTGVAPVGQGDPAASGGAAGSPAMPEGRPVAVPATWPAGSPAAGYAGAGVPVGRPQQPWGRPPAYPAAAAPAGYGVRPPMGYPAGGAWPYPPSGPTPRGEGLAPRRDGLAPRREGLAPRREGLGPRLVAWTGGTVTLLGIVLLLVLAANRGWLAPEARVVGGAVLALALVGVAAWVDRRPGGRTGAVALAATGVAGLYLDVAAATAYYEYLPVAAGLALAVVAAGGGLALADRWRSQPLAVGAVLGAGVLAPVLTQDVDPTLVALAVVLQLVAVPVVLRRRWHGLTAVAAAWPFGYGLVSVARAVDEGRHPATALAVAAVLIVGVGLAVGGSRRLSVQYCAAQLAVAPLPVLAMALVLDRTPGALVAAAVAVLLFGIAALSASQAATPSAGESDGSAGSAGSSGAESVRPAAGSGLFSVPRGLRAVAVVVGALAGFEATMIALRGGSQTMALLGEAVALAVAAIVLRRRAVLLAAALFGIVGTALAIVRDAPLEALVEFPSRPYLVGGAADTSALLAGAAVSLLVLVVAVLALVAADRVRLLGDRPEALPVWIVVAGVVLYGAAGLLVTLALLVTATRSGFLAGHVLVTVSWTVAALALLVRGIRVPALRVAGGALVIAAVAKLVLFDLSQLDGLARVLAFLGAGLVLLAAGTRYARLVAAAQPDQPPTDLGGPSGPTGPTGPGGPGHGWSGQPNPSWQASQAGWPQPVPQPPGRPSDQPSGPPSGRPTDQPSGQASGSPSDQPSGQASGRPPTPTAGYERGQPGESP